MTMSQAMSVSGSVRQLCFSSTAARSVATRACAMKWASSFDLVSEPLKPVAAARDQSLRSLG